MFRRSFLVLCVETFSLAVLLLTARTANAAGLGPLPATFTGTIPCADCMGLRLHLNLIAGGAYLLASTYYRDGRDETFYDMGAYSLTADSTRLLLASRDSSATQFAVRPDGSLRKLDREGREIASSLPYDLRREVGYVGFEPRLTLRGSYVSMADAASFTDCRSNLRFPVAPGGEAAELQKAFLAERAKRDSLVGTSRSGEPAPLVVTLQGRVSTRPPSGSEGNRPTLIVERFLAAFPGESCGARGVTHELEGTRWVLTRVGTEPVRPVTGQREASITFDAKTGRVAGFGGCNRFTGSYVRSGASGLKLGALASTKMACPGRDFETPFLQALGGTASHRITDAHLELLDASGVVVARLEARNL